MSWLGAAIVVLVIALIDLAIGLVGERLCANG